MKGGTDDHHFDYYASANLNTGDNDEEEEVLHVL